MEIWRDGYMVFFETAHSIQIDVEFKLTAFKYVNIIRKC